MTDEITSTPDLQTQVDTLTAELAAAREQAADLERQHRLERMLRDADTVDVDAARLLTEAAVASMEAPDLELAVSDLRRHKPWLFRQPMRSPGVMAPEPDDAGNDPVHEAAAHAAATGHRRDLLTYLRLRRMTKPK